MKMIDRKYAYLQGLLILVLFALGVAVASSSGTDSSALGDSSRRTHTCRPRVLARTREMA